MSKTMYDLTPELVQSFIHWKEEEPTRTVSFDINSSGNLSISCWDSKIKIVQHVSSADEIDLVWYKKKADSMKELIASYRNGADYTHPEIVKAIEYWERVCEKPIEQLAEASLADIYLETMAKIADIKKEATLEPQ